MKRAHNFLAILSLAFLLAAGCAKNPTSSTSTSGACTPSSTPEASYMLTGYAVSMYTVNSCTGQFTATTPASVGTGYEYPQNDRFGTVSSRPVGALCLCGQPCLQCGWPVQHLDVYGQLHNRSTHANYAGHRLHWMVSPGNRYRSPRTICLHSQQRRRYGLDVHH